MTPKKPTQHQLDFWNEEGPYSQAYIKVERRILDDEMPLYKKAREILVETEQAILRMHSFVIELARHSNNER